VDESKRQKILLGVLALMAVACGTYYFAFRSSGPTQVVQKTTASEPKARQMAVEDTKKPRERTRETEAAATEDEEHVPKARDMGMDEEEEQLKKDRQSGESAKKKKKKVKPAA
jgi:hypothetical protein